MSDRSIHSIMARLEPHLEAFDQVMRSGHKKYQSYPADIVLDHDASTQAHCTHRHLLGAAHATFDDLPGVRHLEIRGQNLWLLEAANAVIRLKKTDEDGISQNYPTPQARAFDRGEELPGLPPAPVRLTVGYLLDATGTEYIRTQVSLPVGRGVDWCAAIVPLDDREDGEAIWYDVTKQTSFS